MKEIEKKDKARTFKSNIKNRYKMNNDEKIHLDNLVSSALGLERAEEFIKTYFTGSKTFYKDKEILFKKFTEGLNQYKLEENPDSYTENKIDKPEQPEIKLKIKNEDKTMQQISNKEAIKLDIPDNLNDKFGQVRFDKGVYEDLKTLLKSKKITLNHFFNVLILSYLQDQEIRERVNNHYNEYIKELYTFL